MNIPEGWTDDMSVNITTEKSDQELSVTLIESLKKRDSYDDMKKICHDIFGLSDEDAELAMDRVQGGIVRAITCNLKNKPDKNKDPLAWHSFNKVWGTLPKLHWWSSKRDNKGEWLDWHNERNL